VNWSTVVAVVGAILGVLLGSISTYLIDKDRSRKKRSWALTDGHVNLCADFLVHVVQWQNQLIWSNEKVMHRAGERDFVPYMEQESARVETLHQATMIPLFKLRLVGAREVVAIAEETMLVVYQLQSAFERGELDAATNDQIAQEWELMRDRFIAAARNGLHQLAAA
jgi:hypothetical protein